MRIFALTLGWDADHAQDTLDLLLHLYLGNLSAVELNSLRDLCADTQHRVEARHRILKNHRDEVAADGVHFRLTCM